MTKKKIFIITPWYNTFSGGAEVAARNLAEECVKRNITTTVLTTTCKSPYSSWWKDSAKAGDEVVNGVIVKRFKVNKYGKEKYERTIQKQINNEKLLEEDKENFYLHGITSDDLVEYVSEIDNDSIIIMIPYFQALAYNVVTKNPNKVALMPCFHNEEQFYWKQVELMIDKCKNLFYLSEPEKDITIKNYGLKYNKKVIESKTVGLGVELNNINIKEGNEELKKLNLPDNYVVYVGRKDIGKGVLQLVDFHKELKVPIVFLGGGDETLIPKDNNNFIDLGFVSENLKYSVISNSKGLINLSKNESFSLVIMEAWLMKVPVIVSDECDVTKYHCRKSNGGFVIKDIQEYKFAIDSLINDKVTSKQLGENGKEYVLKHYNWDNVIYNILEGNSEVTR